MAYELEAWEADGPGGEARLAAVRVKAVDVHRVTEEFRRDPRCVLVTLCRTSQRDMLDQVVWQKPSYGSAATPAMEERVNFVRKQRR